MRLTTALAKRRNVHQPLTPELIARTPFREMLPLKLANEVPMAKTDKVADVTCLQEMAVMFACMKAHDFKEVKCTDEINSFNKCYKEYTAKKKLKKQREESGEMVYGTNQRLLSTKQINALLAKYPQYNKKS